MKRIVWLLLTACVLFTFAACGRTGGEPSVPETAGTSGTGTASGTQAAPTDATNESIPGNDAVSSAAPNAPGKNPAAEVPSASQPGDADAPAPAETVTPPTPSETEETPAPSEAAGTVKATETPAPTPATETTAAPKPTETTPPSSVPAAKKLVVYFSCTGHTKAAAERLAALCGADLYEIVPAVPYTADDLNYNNSGCRANREMNDAHSRPAIGSVAIDLSAYDTVLIGYPIWWGTMPRIVNTFLDTYDLSGKTVMPFCTSGGSDVSRSVSDIQKAAPRADVREGLRVGSTDDRRLEQWLSDNRIL